VAIQKKVTMKPTAKPKTLAQLQKEAKKLGIPLSKDGKKRTAQTLRLMIGKKQSQLALPLKTTKTDSNVMQSRREIIYFAQQIIQAAKAMK
jgi:hypothetical protein